jgi:hypothetical protein
MRHVKLPSVTKYGRSSNYATPTMSAPIRNECTTAYTGSRFSLDRLEGTPKIAGGFPLETVDVQFREGGPALFKPYTALPFERSALVQVVLGPNVNADPPVGMRRNRSRISLHLASYECGMAARLGQNWAKPYSEENVEPWAQSCARDPAAVGGQPDQRRQSPRPRRLSPAPSGG